MATISEKIFELLAERGMTEKILEICSVLAVSPYELLAGTAEGAESGVEMQYIMVDNKSEEYAFLRRFHLLEASKKKRLLGYLDSLVD